MLSSINQEIQKRNSAKQSFTSYCEYVAEDEPPAEHHKLLCDALDKVIDGEIRNLMVFMPPGSAKSTYGSVRFPAYYLGRMGKKNIICASYGADLATGFGRKVRNLVNSKESKAVFPGLSLAEDSQAKGEWETKDAGTYFAVGVGGGVTGRRADLGLIDDPVKSRKEADSELIKEDTWNWYNSDFMTRLKPNAAQVIIQTRWVEDDLSGRILPEDWEGESGTFTGKDGKEWVVISLQAQAEDGKKDPLGRKPGEWLWTDWFTPEYWEQTKKSQENADIRNWSALYQQRPSPEDGIYFKREWFQRYNTKDLPKHLNKFGASDYAVTDDGGDFTEHGVAGLDALDDLYILDWWSGQKEADTWIDAQLDLVQKHKPFVWGAETGQIRRAVEPFMKKRINQRKIFFRREWMPHIGDKQANARSFQAFASQGKVYIPLTEWGESLINQLLSFDAGTFDDKVDVCGLMGRLLDMVWAAQIPREPDKPREYDYGFNDEAEDSWKIA